MSDALSALMLEAFANHIEGATVGDENVVELGFANLKARCRVAHAEGRLATLQLMWWGPATDDIAIFDAWAGMGESPEEAVVNGGQIDGPRLDCNSATSRG